MTDFVTVKLELVRPGEAHNQLLSPLTAYLALCGSSSPVTFHVDLEHHQLLSRLERLRYVSQHDAQLAGIPDRIREDALLEISRDVGRILGTIPTLPSELARVQGQLEGSERIRGVHLRLVLGGSELALIPFEMAASPQGFPGEGIELGLQTAVPVVTTREARTNRESPIGWDQPWGTRVLFVSAAPEGLRVPIEAHIQALRAAVEPWVNWPRGAGPRDPAEMERARLNNVREHLRLLVNASIDDIRDACARERFTHVHILAHGDTYKVAGEERFGVALCQAVDRTRKDVVSGRRLAEALQVSAHNGRWRSRPLVVSLATCDAGNQRSILVPGGSIAHDLHMAGIPWVFASQFPLTIRGSVRMTETLYSSLLRGDDPREVLYAMRRHLHMTADHDHDWAALVAYATVSDNFDDQIYRFFEYRTHRAIEVSLARADDLATTAGADASGNEEWQRQLDNAKEGLDLWLARIPHGDEALDKTRRAECYGIHGSVFKRIALMRYARGERVEKVRTLLNDAFFYYRKAMDEWASTEEKHHWVATQALSLGAVLGAGPDPSTFTLARELARRDLRRGTPEVQAWGHGTMAELEMLGPYHTGAEASEAVRENVREHCRAIVNLVGWKAFHVESTRRQFKRYVDAWQDPRWTAIAQAAVDELTPPSD